MFFGNHVAHFYSVHFKIMESMERKEREVGVKKRAIQLTEY